MPKNASDVAKRWATNLGAATTTIQAGVQAVTVNPASQAAARVDAYAAGVQRAVADGSYVRGLSRVTLQSWQQSMLTKGIQRIASGAAAAQGKVESFMSKWLPYMQGLQAQLAATPRGDINQNIQRMITAVQYNHAFKYQ